MSNETRWRLVEDGTIGIGDVFFTATPDVARYIEEEVNAASEERGDRTTTEAIRADMAEGPRADATADVRAATEELAEASRTLERAIAEVKNIDAAANTVRSLAVVLADAALALRSHEDHLTPKDRGY